MLGCGMRDTQSGEADKPDFPELKSPQKGVNKRRERNGYHLTDSGFWIVKLAKASDLPYPTDFAVCP